MNASLEIQCDDEVKGRRKETSFFRDVSSCLRASEVTEELVILGKTAFPILATCMLFHSKQLISMLFLGRMGKAELAGGSIAIAFANITGFSVMKGLSVAMDPICCQAYGAKRWSVLSQMYLKTFILLLCTCIPVSLLWLNVEPVFLLLGQDPVITRVARIYLFFCLPELIGHAHLHPLRSFLRTQGLNSPATIVATCSTILHLPITYFLSTYLKLGIQGLALSSVLYQFNMNIGLLIYVLLSKVSLSPWAEATTVSLCQGWWPLLSLALPSVFSVCLEWWWYEIIMFLGGLLGDPESTIGAIGILIQTTGTIYVIPYAISLSISQRVGHELGAGEAKRAQRATIVGITIAIAYGFSALVLSFALRSVWGKMYTNEKHTLMLISQALPVLGLAEVGNAPQTAACGVLMGSARPKLGVRVNVASFYLIGLPIAIVLVFVLDIGFWGLWWGLVGAQHSCVLMMFYILYKTDWKHEAKRAEELTLAAEEKEVATNLVSET